MGPSVTDQLDAETNLTPVEISSRLLLLAPSPNSRRKSATLLSKLPEAPVSTFLQAMVPVSRVAPGTYFIDKVTMELLAGEVKGLVSVNAVVAEPRQSGSPLTSGWYRTHTPCLSAVAVIALPAVNARQSLLEALAGNAYSG